jgi:RNA polymerase sigma-70 factor (ECF subfamily)
MDGQYPLTSSTATSDLLLDFQVGDEQALERLWARYLPRLKKWAHGRLPCPGRTSADTDDLVQDAFVRSLAHLRTLKPRRSQSLFAYFKTVILNQVRDYMRQAIRRPVDTLAESDHVTPDASPLEQVLGQEAIARYERGLAALSEEDQDVILAVVELGCTDRELAELFEKPSIDAARMARGRALARLARAMQGGK